MKRILTFIVFFALMLSVLYARIVPLEDELTDNNTDNHHLIVTETASDFFWSENFNAASLPAGWTRIDADGDGFNWERTAASLYPPALPGSSGIVISETWAHVGAGTYFLDPDNWLITPPISIPANINPVLKYFVRAMNPLQANDTYSVLVSTTTNSQSSFTSIFNETLLREHGDWTERMLSLADFAGETIYIAFRHHDVLNVNNAYVLGMGNLSIFVPQIGEYDLIAEDIYGETALIKNLSTTHTISVYNAGTLPTANYTVGLMMVVPDADDIEIAKVQGQNIEPDQTRNIEIRWLPTLEGEFQLYGIINFVPDTNIANNRTNNLTVFIDDTGVPDTISFLVGNPLSSNMHQNPPFHFWEGSSLSQTIFLPSEIPYAGVITAIGYRFYRQSGTFPENTRVQLYMATTNVNSFVSQTSWLPYENFILVYDGIFPNYPANSVNDIVLELDTPFPYDRSQNLVLMTHREMGAYAQNPHHFQSSSHDGNRVIVRHNRQINMDPKLGLGMEFSSLAGYSANTWFEMQTTYLSSLSGTVSLDGNPIEGVEINITGTGVKAISDDQGYYRFDLLQAGTYSLTVSKVMYKTQVIEGVFVDIGENNLDIYMSQFDYDLAITDLEGSLFPTRNQNNEYLITVSNFGKMPAPAENYTVQLLEWNLWGVDTVLDTKPGVYLSSGEIQSIPLIYRPTDLGERDIYARIVYQMDEFTENNETDKMTVNVQEDNISFAVIGDPTSLRYNDWAPFQLIQVNGIAQTIYYEHEIATTGWITHITYDFWSWDGDLPANTFVRLFMGTTDQITYTDNYDWVPIENHILVYEGNVNFSQQGSYLITLELDTPYLYQGGNLSILGHKPMGVSSGSGNQFRSTATNISRTMHAGHETTVYYPDESVNMYWGWYNVSDFIPNIRLQFFRGGGTISGVVTSEGSPIKDIVVSITGTDRSAVTNENGEYSLPYVEAGIVSITASGIGFDDYVNTDVEVTESEITNLDIDLNMLPNVRVSGRIIASDTNAGLSGVSVKLRGFKSYDVYTNIQGDFVINHVISDKMYELTVSCDRYETYSMPTFFVASSDIVLDNITLLERPTAPRNVTAMEEGDNIRISWDDPRDGSDVWFSHTTRNTFFDGAGVNGPFTLSYGQRYTQNQLQAFGVSGAYLNTVSFMSRESGNVATFSIQIYTGGSGNPLHPGTLVHQQFVPAGDIKLRQWTTIDLYKQVPIPSLGEMWVIISMTTTDGRPAGIDQGPAYDGFANIIFYENRWTTLKTEFPLMDFNFMIRSMAVGASGPVLLSEMPEEPFSITQEYPTYRRGNPSGYPFQAGKSNNSESLKITRSYDDASYELNDVSSILSSRALESFNIWRALADYPNDSRELIAFELTDTNYLDTSWSDIDNSLYRYIVEAVYTNTNVSLPAFSNIVGKNMMSEVRINVNTHDFGSVSGTIVRLVNNDGNPDHVYERTIQGNLVIFPIVWKGVYTLTIDHPNYFIHQDRAFVIDSNPLNSNITMVAPNVLLHEYFETQTFPPIGWTLIDYDGDGINWYREDHPGLAVFGEAIAASESWYSVPHPNGTTLYPDNWLITPPITIPHSHANLTYYIAIGDADYPIETYGIFVSNIGTDVEHFVPLHEETLSAGNFFWSERNINLSDYAGETINLAFRHFNSFDNWLIMLDFILVTSADRVTSETGHTIPELTTRLRANYPNPFNPITQIDFDIAKNQHVKIEVFNIRGQKIKTLINDTFEAGSHKITWNGTDDHGREMSSGIYFYQMTTNDSTQTRKMLLMK